MKTNSEIDWNYLCAIRAYDESNYISIEAVLESDEDNDCPFVDLTECSPENPEQRLLKKEQYDLLREESKQVIDWILNSPNEVLACILGTKKRPYPNIRLTAQKIVFALAKQWPGEYCYASEIVNEIRRYLRENR